MDLFDYMKEKKQEREAPLAMRMRPERLSEVEGQDHILGPGKLLRRAIDADRLSSVILYGPPGTGKTTLARVIAGTTHAEFRQVNATTSGKKELEEVTEQAGKTLGGYGRRTILFIDEIHRFNRAQQDYLLPFVEDGTVILIGATTENPYFEVNTALLSRSTVFELKPLSRDNIRNILKRAMSDPVRGLGSFRARLTDEAETFLADAAGGDARAVLNALELAAMTTERGEDGIVVIDLDAAAECMQKRPVHYDKNGDRHYDTISAFIKSMRGSDPDAAVYYLAKMLEAGEDIRFIARRIMISASEDVGNADPMACVLASAAAQEVERIGMPEAGLVLSQAAIYVACAPKSNACTAAVSLASECVKRVDADVPAHLQDSHYRGHEALGHGVGYKYPHDYPGHYVRQQYLPDEVADTHFYLPSDNGYEKTIGSFLKKLRSS